jgi:hypothetical protein
VGVVGHTGRVFDLDGGGRAASTATIRSSSPPERFGPRSLVGGGYFSVGAPLCHDVQLDRGQAFGDVAGAAARIDGGPKRS